MKIRNIILLILLLYPMISYGKNTLPVGVYLSTTGPIAAWGKLEWEGIKTANEISPNANGKKVILLLEDVGSRPEGAALACEHLVDRGAKFVIGPVTTTNALAAAPILENNRIINVIPTANGMGLIKNRKFASRVCFTNVVQAKVMANYIASDKRYKKGVVIEDISQDYSIDLANRFIKDFKKNNGTILNLYKIQFMQKDFSALATHIKRIKPDFVYITAYYNSIALFLRDLRGIGCKVKVFAGSSASSYALIKIAQKAAEGLIFTDDFDPLIPQNALSKQFIKLFEEKFHRMPDSPEALAADAYLFLIKAIDVSKGNIQKAADYIRNTTFYGVTGKITIKDGRLTRTVVIRKVKNSKFVPIFVFEP